MLRGSVPDEIIDSTIAILQRQLDQLAAPPVSEQLRKVVTILFADIVGSTNITRELDPEDSLSIMENGLRRFSGCVKRQGGHILRFQGDGFVAVFGHTMNREKEPDHAVLAGLAILDAAADFARELESTWGIAGFTVRAGISTGMVVIGGESDMELPLAGATVNLASRMESAAEPGTLLISHDTYQHVRGAFDLKPLPPLAVKGFEDPVPVYQVDGAKARTFRTRRRGVEGVASKMVGRERELARLQALFTTVCDKGVRRMATVVGDAGVGKSRLLFEFENWVDLVPDEVNLYRGRARVENQNIPYALLRDVIAFRFQIRDDDPRPLARKKLATALEERQGTGRQTALEAGLISRLLGFGDAAPSSGHPGVIDPKELRDRALIYFTGQLKEVSRDAPVLIVLEDLHWADDSSLEFLNLLALALRRHPVFLLAAARPSHYERRPTWMQEHRFHERIDLTTLSAADSRALVDDLLQKVRELPESLRELVVGSAEGNPFYLEELIKTLIERGVIEIGDQEWRVNTQDLATTVVPATLAGLLQSRLLALPGPDREMLQQASVVGRVFWDRALRHLNRELDPERRVAGIRGRLDALATKELIHAQDLSSLAEAQEFIFKHALLREVTYGMVLKRMRRRYHALVADWLIGQGDGLSGIFKGVIARHLELAGRAEEAVDYLVAAAKSAEAAFANEEAIAHFTRALALLPADDASARIQLLLSRVRLLGLRGDRNAQLADLEAMEPMAASMADPQSVVLVALERASYSYDVGEFQQGIEAGKEVVEMARQSDLLESEILGCRLLALSLMATGDYALALENLRRGLEVAVETGDERGQGMIYNTLGPVASALGDYPQAREYYEHAVELARRTGDRYLEGAALNNLGNTSLRIEGDYARAMAEYEAAGGIAKTIGDRQGETISLINLGVLAEGLGEFAKARENYRTALTLARDIGDRRLERFALGNLGGIYLPGGDFEQASAHYRQALALARELGDPNGEATMLDGLSEALIGLGEGAEAAAMASHSYQLRDSLGQIERAIESRATLASAALAAGNHAAARVEALAVAAYVDAGGSLDDTANPLGILQRCYIVLSEVGETGHDHLLERAYAGMQARAAKIPDEDLRRSYLEKIPWNRELARLWEAHRSGG
jgi:predicted ATPase/class 3 adenylate cyclase